MVNITPYYILVCFFLISVLLNKKMAFHGVALANNVYSYLYDYVYKSTLQRVEILVISLVIAFHHVTADIHSVWLPNHHFCMQTLENRK